MLVLDDIIGGVIASTTVEVGKIVLGGLLPDKTISQKLEKAFNEALKKWSVNGGVIDIESKKIYTYKKNLIENVRQCQDSSTLDSNTIELIDLFKNEIINDEKTYSILNYWVNQEQLKILKSTEKNVLTISDYFTNLTDKEKSSEDLPHNCFIKELKSTDDYIARKIIKSTDQDVEDTSANRKFIIDVIKSEKSNIVILASAGMGKSTELKEVVSQLANEGLYYPIFKLFNLCNVDKDLEDALPENWDVISNDRLILFLDGLDEIQPADIINAKKLINRFCDKYPDVKVVVSCRTNLYSIPKVGYSGTLKNFNPYYLTEFSLEDIKEYICSRTEVDSGSFIEQLKGIGIFELVRNPFFLKLLMDYYIDKGNIPKNKALILEYCIDYRFLLDQEHYEETVNIEENKHIAFSLLKRISLAIEMVGGTRIKDEDLRIIISKVVNLNLIKYCTVFKKQEVDSDYWAFEHKYFQEYLCAELFATLSFDAIKTFICYDGYDKIIPTWLNTLSLLISILDSDNPLLDELIQWLYVNQSELLINVEKDKLSKELRTRIFKNIFNESKELKIWIDSNKYSIPELAQFCQTDDCIEFVLNEIRDKSNHAIVRNNGLHLLGEFDIQNYVKKDEVRDVLLSLLNGIKVDSGFSFLIIITLEKCKFNCKKTIEEVFKLVGDKSSQYIRAAMYKYIAESDVFENYVEYYIEGYSLLNNKDSEREESSLVDESHNLNEGIKNFKSPEALKKILPIGDQGIMFNYGREPKECLNEIIENASNAYAKDTDIYNYIENLLQNDSLYWHNNAIQIIYDFFARTGTQQKIFHEMLESFLSGKRSHNKRLTLVHFTNEVNITEIVDCIKRKLITSLSHDEKLSFEIDIKNLYQELKSTNDKLAEMYKQLIQQETSIIIEFAEQSNWDLIRKERTQKAFNLLFDKDAFKFECERIFESKNELNTIELYGLRRDARLDVDLEDRFCESALDLVRAFARDQKLAKKEMVLDWFLKEINFERYFIKTSQKYISNNENLQILESQKAKLKEWFDKYITEIDFSCAITQNSDGTFTYKNYAIYLMFLVKRFGFECTDGVYIDMLSATLNRIGGVELIQFDEIIERVEDQDKLNQRIISNILENKIFQFSIYESHIEYIFKHNLRTAYSKIVKDIVANKYENHQIKDLVNILFKYDKSILLKEVLKDLEIDIALYVVGKLIKLKDIDFCRDHLLLLYENESDEDVLRGVCNYLVQCDSIQGLKYLVEWVKKYKYSPFNYNDKGIGDFTDIEALKYFNELLDLSYSLKITGDMDYLDLRSAVLDAMDRLALYSKENFDQVKDSLNGFLKTNLNKYENIGFLKNTIDHIKENFYKNRVEKYTYNESKKKIERLISENIEIG